MIRLAELIKTFLPDLEQKYGSRLLPSHRQALAAIEQCRTQARGSAASHCHDGDSHAVFPLSCGHRFCPQCQKEVGQVLDQGVFEVGFGIPVLEVEEFQDEGVRWRSSPR